MKTLSAIRGTQIAAAWFLVHAAIYAVMMCRLDSMLHVQLEHAMEHFFGWQVAGFLAAAVVVSARRPSAAGCVLGGYLMLSTLVLLAFSQDAAMIAKFVLLLLWLACSAQGMRQAIAWAAGEPYATWGVATAAVFAALVPIGFLLGILDAITPSNVAALAIATALPGAILWLRRPMEWNVFRRSHADRGNRKPLSIVEWCLLEAVWAILAVEFVGASTSELLSDSARVHLPYMLRVIADHGLSHQYACWYRLQPMAVQTYGAAIAAVGSIAAAKWFSWLALAALVLLVAEEVYRRSGSRRLGLFAGTAVLSCPVLARLSSSLHVDHVMALLCTAGFVVSFRALRQPCLRGILLSAAIMGSMVQVKYTGLIFGVVWGLFLAGNLLRNCGWRVALRWSAAAGALLGATALPWYVYVYLGTGNPVYPYLNHWFPSPYWADGVTLQQVLENTFKLRPGIAGSVTFPWTATYHSSNFAEGYDGLLGFWALALAPCWFLAWRVREKSGIRPCSVAADKQSVQERNVPSSPNAAPYRDMAMVGVAMIACVVAYTPYVRYWLPAYPLLVASCVLAAGSILHSVPWRPAGRWQPVVAGSALALLLLLPAPILCASVPWDAYAHRISAEEHLARSFEGYPAMRQLNPILASNDGVLCTGYNGVYLIGGQPYEFMFRWNKVHHIHDVESFEDFCRRYGIRYWIVNHARPMPCGEDGEAAITAKYWTDARIVSASGTVAIYDLAPEHCEHWKIASQRKWPATLENPPKTWTPSASLEHWVNLSKDPAGSAGDAIVIKNMAWIGHHIEPGLPGDLCRVSLAVWSKEHADPLLEIVWYNANGDLLSRAAGAAHGKSDYEAWICDTVPPGAANGWVYLREWKQRPIELKDGKVTFWKPPTASAVAWHGKPYDEIRGVR